MLATARRLRLVPAYTVVAALAAASCSSAGDDSGAAGGQATAPPQELLTPPMTNSALADVRITAIATTFDQQRLAARAGTVTIEIGNRGTGIPHSFAVYQAEQTLGRPLGATDIETGPAVQHLTVTLAAGEYLFQCDVHPATMRGTLIVK